MPSKPMHADEIPIDAALVGHLVEDQFPHWADLPLDPIESAGTVHVIYRLGDDMQVRLPRLPEWQPDLDKEFHWLPRLAPQLPLAIPTPLARGEPTRDYGLEWSVYDWLEGEMATVERVSNLEQAAVDLAQFASALQEIDAVGGPPNTHRGLPLATADLQTRAAIEKLHGVVDIGAVTEAWDQALDAPAWDRPPLWIHGDLWHSNMLVRNGRLAAVIDFGGCGVGDPAIDTIAAWSLLTADTRDAFRSRLAVDDATWERGKGWALSMAVQALPYYVDTNPVILANGHRMIKEVLADVAR